MSKKAAKKKPSKKKAAKPTKRRVRKAKTPHDQPLPGMESIRVKKLDDLCARIGEIRDELNQNKADDATALQAALTVMHTNDLLTYSHAGVDLIRNPGRETIKARKSKQTASADADAPDETGDAEVEQS